MSSILFFLQKLWIRISYVFRVTHTANRCGHQTKQEGFITCGEHTIIMAMPLAENGHPEYCLDCIGNMTIQCAWCDRRIPIGSPITLYIPKESYAVPNHAVCYTEDDSKALVGCLGSECADAGMDRAGFWLPGEDGRGRVQRVPTIMETLLANPHARAVFVRDTHDIAEALSPKVIN